MHDELVCCVNCVHCQDLTDPNKMEFGTLTCVVDNVIVLDKNVETTSYMWCDGECFERSEK